MRPGAAWPCLAWAEGRVIHSRWTSILTPPCDTSRASDTGERQCSSISMTTRGPAVQRDLPGPTDRAQPWPATAQDEMQLGKPPSVPGGGQHALARSLLQQLQRQTYDATIS